MVVFHHIDIQDIHCMRKYFCNLSFESISFQIVRISLINSNLFPNSRPYGNFHHPSAYPVTAPIPPPTIPSPSASPRTVDTKPNRDYTHVRRISPNSDKSANSENSEKPAAPVSLNSFQWELIRIELYCRN